VLLAAGPAAAADSDAPAPKDRVMHRKGVILVKAAPGVTVRVEQLRHAFRFGAAARPTSKAVEEVLLANFNSIVPPNCVKWHETEKKRGEPDYRRMDEAVAWAEKAGFTVRGHNIFWDQPYLPGWVTRLKGPEALAAYEKRAREVAGRYRGRLIDWDFRNEILNGGHWDERTMGKGIYAKMTRWVKEADPDVNVCMNEFDVLSNTRKCEAYIRRFRSILENGGVVDVLGCQGHYHGEDFNRRTLKRCLDMLAELKRPIIITEFNMPGQTSRYCKNTKLTLTPEQEKKKAVNLRDYLRICFEHPAVEGFYFWGIIGNANWIPASSLWSQDHKPTPALAEYRRLVFGEWWTKFDGRTDEKGECRMPAFFGKHKVSVDGDERTVELKNKAGSVMVDFTRK
jgi:endo-1,4-beta-xylanase